MKKHKATQPTASATDLRLAELTADLQRTRADFENYRKQMDAQKQQAVNIAREETVKKLLPLLDDFSRAFYATPELKPLEKSLEKSLKDLGLAQINSAPGVEFSPDFHDAVMTVELTDGAKPDTIAETLRPGYTYFGSVIRPAMVKVYSA